MENVLMINLKDLKDSEWLKDLFPNDDLVSLEDILNKLYELKTELADTLEDMQENYTFRENGNIEYGVCEDDFH